MTEVVEGGIATRLQGLHEPGTAPDLLCLTMPTAVSNLHIESANAGATVLVTNTFGANPIRLARDGQDSQTREINMAAAELAIEATLRPDLPGLKVAGSVGPTGELLDVYGGALTVDACYDSYREQALALAGVDLFLVETMYDLDEARMATRACVRRGKPTVVSFSFERQCTTMMGVTAKQAVAMAAEEGAVGIGMNCGASLETSVSNIPVLAPLAATFGLEFWFRPNCGVPHVTREGTVYPSSPADLATACRAAAMFEAAAVGACCGSTGLHTAAIMGAVRS